MAVYYLSTANGYFPFIVDSNVYNYFSGKYSSATYLIENGIVVENSLSEFKAGFPSGVALPVLLNASDAGYTGVGGEALSYIMNVFDTVPEFRYEVIEGDVPVDDNTGRYVQVSGDHRTTPLKLNNVGDIAVYGGSNTNGYVFGFARPYSSGVGDEVIFSIGIFSDDYSKFLSLKFTCIVYGTTFQILYVIRGGNNTPSKFTSLAEFFSGATASEEPPTPSTDPYSKGGESETGGGTGDFDGASDSIDIPSLPSVSAASAGFITLFNPTNAQLNSLASYMWSDLFDVDSFRKIFANPMDAVLGLSIVPVAVPSSGTAEVRVGNISTGVSMNVASSQFVTVDCGTINVNEYWGAYLDYEPFTKAEIYLPYIGTHPIAVDDIMGKAVRVVYHVDVLSGACVAYVKCGSSVLYNFIGQCSASIPITGNDWTNVVNGVLNIAGAIGTMVATGGAAAPLALGEIASTAVNSMKPSVEKSGAMGGTGGLMGIQKPYLVLTRPRQAVPKNQNKYTGYPSYINRKLSDLRGYTEIDSIHIEGVYATEQEYAELDALLKSGVIF